MAHDATKVLLGTTGSSDRVVSQYGSDPADTPAGFAVSLASTGVLAKTASSGMRVGVSLGKSLSDNKKTAVCRAGMGVPIRCASSYALAMVTITSYANLVDDNDDTLTIGAQAFTAQTGGATPTQATFQAASSNEATATSLATQINAHVATAALVTAVAVGAVVYIVSDVEGADGEIPLIYDDVDGTGDSVGLTLAGPTPFPAAEAGVVTGELGLFSPAAGTVVYVDSITAEACSQYAEKAVVSNATYEKGGIFDGITEDSTEVPCAVINMTGGL